MACYFSFPTMHTRMCQNRQTAVVDLVLIIDLWMFDKSS